MRGNNLGCGTAHYTRRSAIDTVYANIFLDLFAEVIVSLWAKNIYNFDETSVRIVNSCIKNRIKKKKKKKKKKKNRSNKKKLKAKRSRRVHSYCNNSSRRKITIDCFEKRKKIEIIFWILN